MMADTRPVVLITGGSDGLGATAARRLARSHQLVVLARHQSRLEQLASEIGCQWVAADVTEADELEGALQQIYRWHQRLDIVITSAGQLLEGALDQLSPDEIRRTLDVNLLGTILTARAVLPRMKQLQRGRLIFLGSQAGLVGRRYRSIYNASKWALRGFAASLQQEVVKYGIGVSLIHPGLMKTELLKKAGVASDLEHGLEPTEVVRLIELIIATPAQVTIPEIGILTLSDVHCW